METVELQFILGELKIIDSEMLAASIHLAETQRQYDAAGSKILALQEKIEELLLKL